MKVDYWFLCALVLVLGYVVKRFELPGVSSAISLLFFTVAGLMILWKDGVRLIALEYFLLIYGYVVAVSFLHFESNPKIVQNVVNLSAMMFLGYALSCLRDDHVALFFGSLTVIVYCSGVVLSLHGILQFVLVLGRVVPTLRDGFVEYANIGYGLNSFIPVLTIGGLRLARIKSIFLEPGYFAVFLLLATVSAFHQKARSRFGRYIIALALILTFSVSAYALFVLFFVLRRSCFPATGRSRITVAAGSSIGGVAAGVLVWFLFFSADPLLRSASTMDRFAVLYGGIHHAEQTLWGYGLTGIFLDSTLPYVIRPNEGSGSSMVDVWLIGGLPLSLLMFIAYAFLLSIAFRSLRELNDECRKYIAIFFVLILVNSIYPLPRDRSPYVPRRSGAN